MNKELDTYKMTAWSWGMITFVVAAVIASVVALEFKDTVGWPSFIPCIVFLGFAIFFAVKVELLKKKHNLKTYAEILAFMKNDPVDRELTTWSKKRQILAILAKMLLGIVFVLVIFTIAFFVRLIFFRLPWPA